MRYNNYACFPLEMILEKRVFGCNCAAGVDIFMKFSALVFHVLISLFHLFVFFCISLSFGSVQAFFHINLCSLEPSY